MNICSMCKKDIGTCGGYHVGPGPWSDELEVVAVETKIEVAAEVAAEPVVEKPTEEVVEVTAEVVEPAVQEPVVESSEVTEATPEVKTTRRKK